LPSDNPRIRPELAPQAVADHGHSCAARRFLELEPASYPGMHAKGVEEREADLRLLQRADVGGASGAQQDGTVGTIDAGHRAKGRCSCPPECHRPEGRGTRPETLTIGLPDANQARRLLEGERAPECLRQQLEDEEVGGHGHTKRGDHRQGIRGPPRERPPGCPQIE